MVSAKKLAKLLAYHPFASRDGREGGQLLIAMRFPYAKGQYVVLVDRWPHGGEACIIVRNILQRVIDFPGNPLDFFVEKT